MGALLRRIDGYWLAPMPPERLATIRLLVGLYALVYLIIRTPFLLSYAHFDPAQFEPVGVVGVLPRPLLPGVVQALVIGTLAFAPAFLLGWRFRITGPVFAGLLLWVLTYSNSWGQILHTDNLLMLQVIALALAPSAEALSLDAKRSATSPRSPDGRFGWPIRLMCALCVAAYVLAGIAKIKNGGTAFIEGDTLRNYVAFDNVRKLELGSIHSPLGAMLLPYSSVFAGLAAVTLVLELGAPVALLGRRFATVWVLAMWGFHVGVLAIMAIAFVYPLTGIAFAPFFRTERLLRRRPLSQVARWLGARHPSGAERGNTAS